MANRVKLDTIRHLNDHYGFEHLNPMIAVGHYNGEPVPGSTTYEFGVYAIYIKETKGCELNYGLVVRISLIQQQRSPAPFERGGRSAERGALAD